MPDFRGEEERRLAAAAAGFPDAAWIFGTVRRAQSSKRKAGSRDAHEAQESSFVEVTPGGSGELGLSLCLLDDPFLWLLRVEELPSVRPIGDQRSLPPRRGARRKASGVRSL